MFAMGEILMLIILAVIGENPKKKNGEHYRAEASALR
jgi:hypothetical protein